MLASTITISLQRDALIRFNIYHENYVTMITYEEAISNEMVEEKIRQLKPIPPELAAVAERIHEMKLKETVDTIIADDALEALLKVQAMREARGKALTDERAQRIVNELRPKHPVFAAIIERGHQMDLGETVAALIVIDVLKRFLRIHAARLATD
jgi:hypothetical protein